MKLEILYIHPTPVFGGASKSLIELYKGFPQEAVHGTVICPRGRAAEYFQAAGMDVVESSFISQWDNTKYGHYRGIRWLILVREFWFLLPTFLTIYHTLKSRSFDLIHANEITLLPVACYAKWFSEKPLIIHVRSLQRIPDDGIISRLFNAMLSKANAIIAIDQTVARTLSPKLPISVIHNGFKKPSRSKKIKNHNLFQVAMVGVLLKLKGVYEFAEAARLCRDRGLNVQFLLVGENSRQLKGFLKWFFKITGFAHDVRGDLEKYLHENSLNDCVKLIGFVSDVHSIYCEIDLLCFPSHLDAAGRPVFEAAFYGVPSLVAVRDPEPDTIIDGETGLCIRAKDPESIADAVENLMQNYEELRRLGENARRLAVKNFDILTNAQQTFDLYNQVLMNCP